MTSLVTEKATKMNAWQMPESSKYLREDLVLDNGHWTRFWKEVVFCSHKEPGIILRKKCYWNSQKADILLSVQRLHPIHGHAQRSLSVFSSSLSISCRSSTSSLSSWLTVTPWQSTTCATPRTGPSSPWTITSPSQPHDSFPDACEAINGFWSMSRNFIYLHHVEPRVKLYSPREESFPIPLKYIDVSRITHTNLDVMQERRIDDYWNIDGSRDLSDSWTGFTQSTLLEEKPPDGYMWSGERLTRKQLTSRPDHLCPELWTKLGKMLSWRRDINGPMNNRNSIMPEDYEEFISLILRTRNSKKPLRLLTRNWKRRWLLICLARQARHVSMVGPVEKPMRSNRNLSASWKPVNPQDCVWKTLDQIIMRTILQEKGQFTTTL